MKISSFKDLEIWKEAKEIVVSIYKLTNDNKFKYDFSFKDQIRRSAVSIPSNIAEGFERDNNNELVHFLRIAKGSCAELSTQIEIAYEIIYLDKYKYDNISSKLIILNSKIGKFISYLLTNKKIYKPNKLTR
jgi:four helix bundle protein